MPAAYGGSGASSSGTTSVTPAYPTVSAGDLMLLVVVNKYPTNGPSTPAGWTLETQGSGGNGAAGVDTGTVYITVFSKIADGTESGTLTVTVNSGNSTGARIFYFTKAAAESWAALLGASFANNTPGTTTTVTTSARIKLKTNDILFAATGINTDAFTYSNQAHSMSGITFGTNFERWDAGGSPGDDVGAMVTTQKVTGGDTDGFLTYTFSSSGSTANAPAGATAILRVRSSIAAMDGNRRRYIVTRINKQSPRMEDILEDLYEKRRGR